MFVTVDIQFAINNMPVCVLFSVLLTNHSSDKNQEELYGGGGASSTYGGEVHTEFWRGSPAEREHLEVSGADRRRILKWIFKK
jgi:hypothetical protein